MKKLTSVFIIALGFVSVSFGNIHAATASFFTSGAGTYFTGQTVNVTVSVNSDSTYNAVSVNVDFSNMTYLGASVVGGWTGVSGPSVSGNRVSFSGALLGSTASGSRSVLALSFRLPNSASQASIVSSGTIALADGSGTPVSGGGNTAIFNVVNPPPPPDPVPESVNIESESHPKQDVWYGISDVKLKWNKQDKVSDFSYVLDQKTDTDPGESSKGDGTSAEFFDLKDGRHYFHIKAKNNVGWGPTSHFTILIDKTSPDPFALAAIESDDDMLIIYFAAFDRTSGIEGFGVMIDGEEAKEPVSGLKVPMSTKRIEVDAFDKAGNIQSAYLDLNKTVEVKEEIVPENPQSGIDIKSVVITAAAIITIQAIILLGYILFKRHRLRNLKTP